ncbi:hypothetical protein [Parasphingorhabdus sp.]|uniref:hypothetical protein n=1 Tax=Parasphingorhabdus sp. TaxID=2709688 RepID=UPI0032658C48
MIPVDPVNIFDPAPFGPFSYYAHIGIGVIGLLAAILALSTKKGSPVHIWSGRTFMVCVVLVAITALILLATRMAPPLMVAACASVYAIATAWLALKPGSDKVRRAEYGWSIFLLAVMAVFTSMAIPTVLAGQIPAIGPLVICIIPLVLLAGDANFFVKPDQREALRIRRHLARMIWAFVISVRAPLAEFYAELDIPVAFILFGPLIVAPMMIWFFLWKQNSVLSRNP